MRLLNFLFFLFYFSCALGQTAYKQGDIIKNFIVAKCLNHTASNVNFNTLKKELTVIDFFGTWCAPCIKALPKLEKLQNNNQHRLVIVLVSTESSTQLNKFIDAQKKLPFPVIVDSDKTISDLFQPPSYPYTIVINRNNKILAITEAADITDEKIKNWLTQDSKIINEDTGVNLPASSPKIHAMPKENKSSDPELSEQFIYAAKIGSETTLLKQKLKTLNFDSLKKELNTDDKKKAFWINLYNGFTQLFLKKDPDKYKNRNAFFKANQIEVAGIKFSLDEIEHDILRRSKVKWSLGYFNKLFPGKKIKALRVDRVDYRIHFALNCGAKSCPPIAFYQSSNLQNQLNIATISYLTGEAIYNAEKNSLQLPALMSWFRHDFKGKKGMMLLVKKYSIVPEDKNPSITFKKYDWNIYLNNYKN